ncbi:hypothetical protein [Streptomyces sp. NBC_01615]
MAVYDFGTHGEQHYLVMELVDGWTLRQGCPRTAHRWRRPWPLRTARA